MAEGLRLLVGLVVFKLLVLKKFKVGLVRNFNLVAVWVVWIEVVSFGEGLGSDKMQGLFDRSGQFWGGEASGNVDSQGVQGCLSVNASRNGGESGETQDGNDEDRSGGGAQGFRPRALGNKRYRGHRHF